jgi:4-amino-4-deoxychorismate lyase
MNNNSLGITLINSLLQDTISSNNRLVQFGDGVFETIKIANNKIELWKLHYERLKKGLKRLNINQVDENQLLLDIRSAITHYSKPSPSDVFVCKIIVSRGESLGGYSYKSKITPTIVVQIKQMQEFKQNLILDYSGIPLSNSKHLAEIKHCNRLEQILATSYIKNCDDVIMCSQDKNIVSTTNSNIFIVKSGKIFTPKIESCGIKGTIRQAILDIENVEISCIPKNFILDADSIILTNSIRKIRAVSSIKDKKYCTNNKFIENIKIKLETYINNNSTNL